MSTEPSPPRPDPPNSLRGRWNSALSGSPKPDRSQDTNTSASWLWWLLAALILVIIALAILSAA